MITRMITRRNFNRNLAITATGTAFASATPMTARSYAQIAGANDRVNFAIFGLNSRAYAHLSALAADMNKGSTRVTHVCDVDQTILAKYVKQSQKELGYVPAADTDFRKVLESKDVDAITIAMPDHWHAPMAIYGLKANKHVYVEKPSSYNPREGELLVLAQQKYNKKVQVGDQQRSAPESIKVVKMIQDGVVGRAYFAKAWYANKRKSMGVGKVVPVPATLNWDLWQGPAPRSAYKDNIHPYNWHWLFRYGTGEALNNGTHEVDVARWCLGAGYPQRITSTAGRFAFTDDWQYYDTMVTSFEYPDQMISWEGVCCNNQKYYGRDRGVLVRGTTGSVVLDRGGYEIFDLDGKKTDELKAPHDAASTNDLVSRDTMTSLHFNNFINAIRKDEPLHSPIQVANVSVTMLQLSNVAWRVNRELKLDTQTGHVLNDPEAMKLWSRDYEKGWEVTV